MKIPLMKTFYFLLLLAGIQSISAQNKLELTPNGFGSISIEKPNFPNDRIQEQIKYWIADFNRNNQKPYEIFQVSSTTIKSDAYRDNAFFYRNKGETFQHRIKYQITFDIEDSVIIYQFKIIGIYDSDKPLELTIEKLYNSEGKLKSDYEEVKPSLERTANLILNSFINYLKLLR